MELLPEGNLTNLLHSGQELQWNDRLTIADDIAKGIKALHSKEPKPVFQSRSIFLQ